MLQPTLVDNLPDEELLPFEIGVRDTACVIAVFEQGFRNVGQLPLTEKPIPEIQILGGLVLGAISADTQ
jgi:hypothetical protein